MTAAPLTIDRARRVRAATWIAQLTLALLLAAMAVFLGAGKATPLLIGAAVGILVASGVGLGVQADTTRRPSPTHEKE